LLDLVVYLSSEFLKFTLCNNYWHNRFGDNDLFLVGTVIIPSAFAFIPFLLHSCPKSNVEHELLWVQPVMLAYVMLWAAHSLAVALPLPWQKHLITNSSARISPSMVQHDWSRIISLLGSPALSPKTRGYSSGRKSGQKQSPRPRIPVIKKAKSRHPAPQIAA
jgi:hypothetical protein